MASRVCVIAAHPDDEVLGCGGTMARRASQGDEVHVLIVSEGLTARDASRDAVGRAADVTALQEAARTANALLGVREVSFGGFPDNRLDSVDLLDVIKAVEGFLAPHRPQIIYTHHPGDLNVDHRIVSQAVTTACRPMPAAHTCTLLYFEVCSSTEWQPPAAATPFAPDWFEDISRNLPAKLEALRCYASEMRAWPHSRSYEAVQALAHWRGASVGLQAAEAFALGRRVVIGEQQP